MATRAYLKREDCKCFFFVILYSRCGVLEDVLGLEDTFWSPWPWPQSLKSSKIVLSSARGQHYFLNRWKFVGKCQKLRRKFVKAFFVFLKWKSLEIKFWRPFSPEKFFEDLFLWLLEKFFWKPSFFWRTLAPVSLVRDLGLERVCPWPWPRNFFVSLALALASSLVSSTPPLLYRACLRLSYESTKWNYF